MNRMKVNENGFHCSIWFALCINWIHPSITIYSIISNGFLQELRMETNCQRVLYLSYYQRNKSINGIKEYNRKGLYIRNHYYTENRKFQSIVFGIDWNYFHMEYSGLIYFRMHTVTFFLNDYGTKSESVLCKLFLIRP